MIPVKFPPLLLNQVRIYAFYPTPDNVENEFFLDFHFLVYAGSPSERLYQFLKEAIKFDWYDITSVRLYKDQPPSPGMLKCVSLAPSERSEFQSNLLSPAKAKFSFVPVK